MSKGKVTVTVTKTLRELLDNPSNLHRKKKSQDEMGGGRGESASQTGTGRQVMVKQRSHMVNT